MNVLPRFLFLFQCIPFFLSKSFFCQLDKMISKFIWGTQHPSISKDFLQRPRAGGGLALPNFRSYYWAANVHKIAYWIQSPGIDWCEMEGMSCISSSLLALVSSNLPMNPTLNPTLWLYQLSKYGHNSGGRITWGRLFWLILRCVTITISYQPNGITPS